MVKKSGQLVVKGGNSRKGSWKGIARNVVEERIYERTTLSVYASNTGVIAGNFYYVAPSTLILASRLSGYQAIRDDIRIDHVRCTFNPAFKGTTSGRLVLYLERDPTEAVSSTVLLANDQFEKSCGALTDKLVLNWVPQQPTDLAFQPLSPGTAQLAFFTLVADTLSSNGVAVPITGVIGSLDLELTATLRGRPN
jgi:hypothetical protein